jgi:hypothetical protein
MKLAVALLVFADLLLRGAAVPHAHAPDAADHAQSLRPHVHVTWDDHEGEGRSHDHASPANDHAVIYLDGAVMMFIAADHANAAPSWIAWVTPAMECPFCPSADTTARSGADRPPGDGAATIHDLLPHVLRI